MRTTIPPADHPGTALVPARFGYRRAALEAAGVAPPRPEWTRERVLERSARTDRHGRPPLSSRWRRPGGDEIPATHVVITPPRLLAPGRRGLAAPPGSHFLIGTAPDGCADPIRQADGGRHRLSPRKRPGRFLLPPRARHRTPVVNDRVGAQRRRLVPGRGRHSEAWPPHRFRGMRGRRLASFSMLDLSRKPKIAPDARWEVAP
jgi:hypothetical protein